jgi:murein DD-endopeptidase MepM/ murein hydrolase activator NlpD
MSGAWLAHPAPGWPISQRYGEHPEAYAKFGLPGHEGIDWACPEGTPVQAAAAGKIVTLVRTPNGHPYGQHLRLWHQREGESWISVYAHLSRIAPELVAGAWVSQGRLIGWSGNTGNSTGPHLHFSLRRNGGIVDPEPWIMAEAHAK